MKTLNTDPIFAPEAQEVFVPGERVFLTRAVPDANEGAEATYAGHLNERLAVLDFDTPSGEPFRVSVPFDSVKNLYR